MQITEITYEQCLPLWEELWSSRVSPITPTSAMLLTDGEDRKYSMDIGDPIFLGAWLNGELAGVNSLHRIGGSTRSRGLYVRGAHRGKGIGKALLCETIRLAGAGGCWSYPKEEALQTYLSAGFTQHSPLFYDAVEQKSNCYVLSGLTLV